MIVSTLRTSQEKPLENISHHIEYFVDDLPQKTDHHSRTPIEIMEHAGKDPLDHYLERLGGPGQDAISFADRPTDPIELHSGERFVTVRKEIKFEIFVNTIKHEWKHERIAFEQVVHLAFPHGVEGISDPIYTVTFRKAKHDRSGTLTEGEHLEVRNGTTFTVTGTTKS